jgi:CHASE1-domain containing sensor protein
MRAIREAAYGGAPAGPLLLTLALAGIYLALGVVVLRRVLDSARRRATLSLA